MSLSSIQPENSRANIIPTPDRPAHDELMRVILSDFDYTLCGTYGFDPATNNHLPQISPELVEAAQDHNLVVATGRRANHPSIPLLWQSGLVHPETPIIAENGGTLVFRTETGLRHVDLVSGEDIGTIHDARTAIREGVTGVAEGQELIFKLGRTMLVTRIQSPDGEVDPTQHRQLVEQVRDLLPSPVLQVVDTRVSITIQHTGINKAVGFRRYLDMLGINRKEMHVVGMGDGENDKEIFEEADVRIGFSSIVRSLVDIDVPGGAVSAPKVLRSLQKNADRQLHAN